MDIFSYTAKSEKKVLSEMQTSLSSGLENVELSRRRRQYGSNVLESREVKWWLILQRQFKSAFIYLLLAAAVTTFLLKDFVNSSMILFFVLINASLGFYQEYRSEKTVQFLKRYVASYATVCREGKQTIVRAETLVPGDILILKTGDKIPADVRFLKTESLRVNESVLTGESAPVSKQTGALKRVATSYYQSLNLGFSGTTVIEGMAEAVVLATGRNSSIGRVAKMAGETERVSSFEKGISRFADFIIKLVGLTILIIFVANIIIKKGNLDIVELIVFSIALTVSIIPEALPVVTVCSLSSGARRLAKQKIIVKRLSAVEDLGGIQVLCSDKTGTLTENKLTVTEFKGADRTAALFYANLAGDFKQDKKIESFDIAFWSELGQVERKKIRSCNKIAETPFNPKTRYGFCLIDDGQTNKLVVRGAPESVLALCSLNEKEKQDIEQWVSNQGRCGRRVLAIARKRVDPYTKNFGLWVDSVYVKSKLNLEPDGDFEFLGLFSFTDKIKKSAFAVAKKAGQLGVKIKIITGDSREVAGAVAYQIGINQGPEDVMTAREWEELNEEDKSVALEKYAVFARVSPEQKYEIVKMMQKKYEVGFLGEGINDAPVLKVAGVALVVDKSADVARESADIILLNRNLGIILDGIAEGRKVFANTIKYVKVTLASNFGNFFAVAVASLLIDFLPLLPLQILLLNLLSDFPMIAIATDTVDDRELVSPRKYEVKNIALFSVIFGFLSAIFDFIFFALFFRWGAGILQTNWFIASVLTELVFLFSVRAKLSFIKTKLPSLLLLCLAFLAMIITVGLPFTVFGQKVFSFIRPMAGHLILILSLVFLYFILNEILKSIYYKNSEEQVLINRRFN